MYFPSETHHKLELRDITFVDNIRVSCRVAWKYYIEHNSNIRVLREKIEALLTKEISWDVSSGWVSEGYPISQQALTIAEPWTQVGWWCYLFIQKYLF